MADVSETLFDGLVGSPVKISTKYLLTPEAPGRPASVVKGGTNCRPP